MPHMHLFGEASKNILNTYVDLHETFILNIMNIYVDPLEQLSEDII
jgi:hypothetical protein